jgi:CheY-like chemotaxis protein
MKILLVEDDPVNQKVTARLLSKWNMETEIAGNGREALEKLSSFSYDLVLMDLNIPVMDGCETVRKIRSEDTPYRQVPVFAYSSSDTADTTLKANALLMNDFVSKPLNPFELHCKINEHVLQPKVDARPTRIKFDFFQSDKSFERDLLNLIIGNIKELEYACFKSYYTNDGKPYQTTAHKVKSTLLLLDDNEYSYVVDDLKEAFSRERSSDELQKKINRFSALSEGIIKTLQANGIQDELVP